MSCSKTTDEGETTDCCKKITYYFHNDSSLLSIFLEHKTAINPMTTLSSEMADASPKPIFRVRPKQPTPYARLTAIISKSMCSLFMFILI